MRSGPRPELLEADPDALLDALEYLNGPRADDNRDRWSSWLPASASYGADHPRTSYVRLEGSRWLAQTGDLAGGLRQQERALDAMRKARSLFGPNPNIVVARYEIADLQGQAGDAAGALSAIEQTPSQRHWRNSGPIIPNTTRMRDSLAGWRAAVGDLTGSVKALEDVVAESQAAIFGPNQLRDPHLAPATRPRSGLSQETPPAPWPSSSSSFRRMTQLLGPADRWTLATRSGQADALGENGDPRGAVAALEQLVRDQTRYLGPDHPDTLSTRMLLAVLASEKPEHLPQHGSRTPTSSPTRCASSDPITP